MTPKELQELRQVINETMSSVRAIKGEEFTDILDFMNQSIQLTKIVTSLASNAEPRIREIVGIQLTHTMAMACNLIMNAYCFEEKEQEEIIKWAEMISNRVDEYALRSKH